MGIFVQKILKVSIVHRYVVLIATVLVVIAGLFSYQRLVIDAVPDITNVQVQINTAAPGYSPFEVERRVTQPIELQLAGLPALESTRSLSRYGLSQVTAVFRDGTDIYFARQLISQRLQEVRERLPAEIAPSMGPIATGLGEIFMFTVEAASNAPRQYSLQELREVQDWIVRPQLKGVPGVIDVNSIGGAAKQIVVAPNLERLRAYELTLDDLSSSLRQNNSNIGAGFIEQNGEQFLVRVPAQVERPEQLADLMVAVHKGVPIFVRDVAQVEVGSELRAGAATESGREVVLGTVFMLMGENGRAVSERVSAKLAEIARSVPDGIVVRPVYNRSDLVNAAIATVRRNLCEGALLVVVVLFLALGNLRAALITACVIPLSMLVTIFGMAQAGLSANLMSLGALDFGIIVDGAVILVENCMRRLGEAQRAHGRRLNEAERLEVVTSAAIEMRQATMFGECIIMVVYIPILALSGIEGKMYHPMALTVLLALFAALIASLTFVPAAVAVCMKGDFSPHGGLMERFQRIYGAFLHQLMRVRWLVVTGAVVVFLASLGIFPLLGAEFVPALDEGDIALHALRIPGTSLTQAIQMQHQVEQAIEQVPEVERVFAKIGTAEIATDPVPPNVADGYVIMKPRNQWSDPTKPKSAVIAELEQLLQQVPGNNYEFTQPIQMRFNELIAGVRSDVAVKLFGDDTAVLLEYGEQIAALLEAVPGAADVKLEQVSGLPMVTVTPERERLARLGISAQQVQNLVRVAYAGEEVGRFYEGDRNFPIVLRLSEAARGSVEALGDIPLQSEVPQPANHGLLGPRLSMAPEPGHRPTLLLRDLATIQVVEGPNQISRENGKRRVVVTANIRGRDVASFVADAQRAVQSRFRLPDGYWLAWGGQYENLLSARARLLVVVPIVLLSVLALIYLTFRSLVYSLLVFTGVPFALSGGVLALWMRGIPFSISAAVGFIALSGVSVLNGLVLVSFARRSETQDGDVEAAVIAGAAARLRPVLMTALVASLGFLPMAIAHGTGSEVQRPLATVVIGGILSSTILTLVVLPVLLVWVRKVVAKGVM
jgi:cobalt-zinc-cadmium resistance protein CzcA